MFILHFVVSIADPHAQVYWTREASEAITTAGSKGLLAYADKCTNELNKIVNLVGLLAGL
jgi:dynein heavy chain